MKRSQGAGPRAGLLMFAAVALPAGTYTPLYSPSPARRAVPVAAFELDREPVTRAEFAGFLRRSPEWRRSRVAAAFADARYLEDWRSDLDFGPPALARVPVTRVSWFAAQAFCRARGAALPTTDQWEYAAADQGREAAATEREILAWYSHPSAARPGPVGARRPNHFGVRDLHGLIWEWTLDFNDAVLGEGAESCGGAAQGALNPRDYAAFMRYSLRASLKAAYTTADLGFRCARSPGKSWDTQDGGKLSLEDERGHTVVLAMIYTSCPGACPVTVRDIKKIEARLSPAARARTRFVLVSFDSERDTAEKLRSFARAQGLDPSRWTLLRGSPDSVRELAALLGVRYRRTDQGDYIHDNLITVLDGQGAIAHQQKGLGADPAESAAAIEKATAQDPRPRPNES